MKKIGACIRPYVPLIVLGVACSAAEAIFELLIPMVMSDIVDVGIPAADTGYILREGLKMVGMAILSLCFGMAGAAVSSIVGMGFGANLRRAEYEQIQTYAFSNIEKFSTASLVTRLTSDVNALQITLMMSMRIAVRSPVMLVAAIAFSVRISARLSSVFLVSLPLLAAVVATIMVKASPMFQALQEQTDALNLVVQENLTGIRVVKSFVREGGETEKFQQRNQALRNTSLKAFGTVVVNMPAMMLIMYSTLIAVMWLGGHMVYNKTLGSGDLMVYFTYITQIMISLMMFSMMFMMATRAIACGRRVAEVLNEPPAMDDTAADTAARVPDGSIDFDGVSFRYHADNPEWVLRNINLHIKSGETVGILGGTGSGKTSLVSLIPRLYECQEGTVRVGGRPVQDYTMEHLRSAVSMVLQKNTLFSGTIRDNLRWGKPDATDEELWEACKTACADEFLKNMPDGLDTDLGQGGVNVSGGQKQRLCIARALLSNPQILILDDSTSAVDMATDAKIRAAFRSGFAGTTKLIIAQRVASVMDADRIVVMDNGAIVDMGTHAELMEQSPIYREVYQSQQEGAIADA
ncbi:MAG: ABC transporter ATP-binding protein [Oscillibacter sp.]|nr:ABC transporter ATP-binding protein [Oscillibacter sp.]